MLRFWCRHKSYLWEYRQGDSECQDDKKYLLYMFHHGWGAGTGAGACRVAEIWKNVHKIESRLIGLQTIK